MADFKYREKGFCQPSNNDADRIVHEAGYAAFGLYVYMLSIRNSVTRECFPSEQFLSEAAGTTNKETSHSIAWETERNRCNLVGRKRTDRDKANLATTNFHQYPKIWKISRRFLLNEWKMKRLEEGNVKESLLALHQ